MIFINVFDSSNENERMDILSFITLQLILFQNDNNMISHIFIDLDNTLYDYNLANSRAVKISLDYMSAKQEFLLKN